MRAAVRAELAAVETPQRVRWPVAVGIEDAAALMSTSAPTVRKLIRAGKLRTLDLTGVADRRQLVSMLSILELDPGYDHRRGLVVLDGVEQADEEWSPGWTPDPLR